MSPIKNFSYNQKTKPHNTQANSLNSKSARMKRCECSQWMLGIDLLSCEGFCSVNTLGNALVTVVESKVFGDSYFVRFTCYKGR